jgi:hypothetical protein
VIDHSTVFGDQNPDDDNDNDDDAESEAIPGPSSSKRSRIASPSPSKRFQMSQQKTTPLHFNVFDQIIAETITNAFTQVNNSKTLTGWLIPSFGCTQDHITVLLYDPKNDVLLTLASQLHIWDEINVAEMSLKTVVYIWMILNFTVFMHKNIANEYRFNSSNFHNLAGSLLNKYWNLQAGKAISTDVSYSDVYYDLFLEAIITGKEIGKR